MNFNENPTESKESISSAAIQPDLCALDFLTENSGSGLNVKCEFGMGAVAVIQCYRRLDRRTCPRLSLALANAIKQEYRTLIFDFSYCSYDERVLANLFDRAGSSGLTW